MLKVYTDKVLGGSNNGVENEIFIPESDLLGNLTLSDDDLIVNQTRALLMFAEKVNKVMSPKGFTSLGQSILKSCSGSEDTHTFKFHLSTVFAVSTLPGTKLNIPNVLPVPEEGVNKDVGGYSLLDIFPNAEKVSKGSTIKSSGISFVVSEVLDSELETFQKLDLKQDSRLLIASFFNDIVKKCEVKTTANKSAILSANISNPITFNFTSQMVDKERGTVGITREELPYVFAVTRTASFFINCELDPTNNTYDVKVK